MKRYCPDIGPERRSWGVKNIPYWHASDHIWPEFLQNSCRRNRNMEIYRLGATLHDCGRSGRFRLDASFAKLAKMDKQAEWEAFVGKYQKCEPGSSSSEKWRMMEQIFQVACEIAWHSSRPKSRAESGGSSKDEVNSFHGWSQGCNLDPCPASPGPREVIFDRGWQLFHQRSTEKDPKWTSSSRNLPNRPSIFTFSPKVQKTLNGDFVFQELQTDPRIFTFHQKVQKKTPKMQIPSLQLYSEG